MTEEDRLCVVLLFCATFGVGSMSLGSIFSAAGPLLASMGVYYVSACNMHASVAVSKALRVTPISVRTFSDLGYYAFGDWGRRVILVSEAGVCFLTPIAFLILGGTSLLPHAFEEGVFDQQLSSTQWILVMALGVLPIILIPTLKGTGLLCYIGGAVAVIADMICITYSLTVLPYSPRETEIQFANVIPTFGTIMFSMGTAILIPPIQRQHSDPRRLASLISLTLLAITAIYMIIGIATYYQFGCTAPDTLLEQLPRGDYRQAACILMLLHVVIAYPVLLNPTLFDLERYLLGKDADLDALQQRVAMRSDQLTAGKPILGAAPSVARLDDDGFLYGHHGHEGTATASASSSEAVPPTDVAGVYFQSYSPTGAATTATATQALSRSHSGSQCGSLTGDLMDVYAESTAFTVQDRICSVLIRALTVALQTFLAVALQTCFMDILSLIGSTAVTLSCMIMPCLCYLKVYPIGTQTRRGQCDRALCHVIILSATVLGVFGTLQALHNISTHLSQYELFAPMEDRASALGNNNDDMDSYPHCHAGERN